MTDDLHITDKQYLVALTVFFFPYALFEVCTHAILVRTGSYLQDSHQATLH